MKSPHRFIQAVAVTLIAMIGITLRGASTVLPTDLVVQGNLSARAMTLSSGSVGDTQVAAGANIAASKLTHVHRVIYAQGSATTAASATQVIYVVIGTTSTVTTVEAGAIVPAVGADTCSVDVKIAGSTILSGAISLTSAQTARQLVTGSPTGGGTLTAGQVLEVVITPSHSSGTLAQGVFLAMDVQETAQ